MDVMVLCPPRSVGKTLPNRQQQYIVVLIFIAQKREENSLGSAFGLSLFEFSTVVPDEPFSIPTKEMYVLIPDPCVGHLLQLCLGVSDPVKEIADVGVVDKEHTSVYHLFDTSVDGGTVTPVGQFRVQDLLSSLMPNHMGLYLSNDLFSVGIFHLLTPVKKSFSTNINFPVFFGVSL